MRENKKSKIEAHVAGICFKGDEVLIAKRASSRKLYPGLWECGGGQVDPGESFEDAVKRQLKEELGVVAKPVEVLSTYAIETPEGKIPGIKIICMFEDYVDKKGPRISEEHAECRWQPVSKLEGFEFIPGIREEIEKAYKKKKN